MPANPQITIYGAYWCPDCRRAKQFLGEHQIPYQWINIEDNRRVQPLRFNRHRRLERIELI